MAEKKGLKKKVMKNKGKFARIRANLEREKANLRRVLKSSGIAAAHAFVELKLKKEKPLGGYLVRLLRGRQPDKQVGRTKTLKAAA